MREKRLFVLNTLNLLWLIILYYIVGAKSIFLYVLSLSLYNIFSACFNHITIKSTLIRLHNIYAQKKMLKIILLIVSVISMLFLLLGILISDIIGIFLKINDSLPIFIIMGVTLFIRPFIKIISEYLECINKDSIYNKMPLIYEIIDKLLVLLIAMITFRLFNTTVMISTVLLYLSKIISAIFVAGYCFLISKHTSNIKYDYANIENINYQKTICNILVNDSYKSVTKIIKNSYYYISIIILYLVLSTRYNFKTTELENIITFIYFYALGIMNYLVYIAKAATDKLPKNTIVTDKLYNSFKMFLSITIVLVIISPLTCKVIFYDSSKSIYLTMANFMAIFILLFDMTYENIKNKAITYISLSVGIITKIILVIPLINSFYRMGYNLIYGDVLSTSIAMLVSIIINYIYLRQLNKTRIVYFTKILDILYDNIILAIVLILFEFIIPINDKDYFTSFGLIIVYIIISIVYVIIKNKIRNKK